MSTLVKVAASSKSIYANNAAYPAARATATGIDPTGPSVGQHPTLGEGSTYYISRAFLNFDTSSISPDAVISAATLTLTLSYLYPDGAPFDVDVVAQDWSAQNPLTEGNKEAAYDACLAAATSSIWANSADLIMDIPKTTAIATGIVAKGGTTYLSLRGATDKAGTTPTLSELLTLWAFDADTPAYRPTLTVTYTVPPAGQTFVRAPFWGRFRTDPNHANIAFSSVRRPHIYGRL